MREDLSIYELKELYRDLHPVFYSVIESSTPSSLDFLSSRNTEKILEEKEQYDNENLKKIRGELW